MRKLDALIELAAKVGAGTLPVFSVTEAAGLGLAINCLDHAVRGSLDAAKALHEAVLPGWTLNSLHQNRNPDNGMPADGTWSCLLFRYNPAIAQVETKADNPARAWLLAILEALIYQEGRGNE
jgi:hypothetical protein